MFQKHEVEHFHTNLAIYNALNELYFFIKSERRLFILYFNILIYDVYFESILTE